MYLGVHVLDHGPENKQYREERLTFLKQQLKLEELVLNESQQNEVLEIFLRNFDACSVNDEDFGASNLLQFHITLLPGSVLVRSRCRPLNPNQEADLNRQLTEWLNAGVIEPTVSPWCSALVPCKKKGTDKLRWSVDYRNLNRCTTKDSYPIPNVQQNLEKLSGANIFSKLDSVGVFHSLTIAESSRDYTTFVSPSGTYRFVRMPYGLSNSPSAYC